MPHTLRRHRKGLASAALGLWLFALFAGITNACSWDGATTVSRMSTTAVHAVGDVAADGSTPHCEEFLSNDLPLPRVLWLMPDPPAGVALLVATHCALGVLQDAAPPSRLPGNAHSPPGVPFLLRIVRLTL